jgi:uncharacterized protein YndB with AHSA1/START domain
MPTQPTENDVVEREIRIAARPETIFSFFTEPEKMLRWKGIDNTLDARPGGIFRVDTNGRDVMRGEFLEVVPYTRIVFTWGAEKGIIPLAPGASTVEVTFVPDGPYTIVHLRHYNLGNAHLRDAHGIGWDHYFERLVIAAEGGDPGPDAWVLTQTMGE